MNDSPAGVTNAALARHADEPGALLPILHDVQDALGFVPREVVPQIAEHLNLSRAEVHGVVTYYHHFRATPPGRHVVQICRAESCKAVGGDALMAHAESVLGCGAGDASASGDGASDQGVTSHGVTPHGITSADGRYTLSPVYCLGLCGSSPAMVVDDRLHARMTPARFDKVIAALGESA